MDKCVNDISLSRETAVEGILKCCQFKPETEVVSLDKALGRFLAEDIYSRNTLPNSLTSSRDGIAVYYDRFINGMPETRNWTEGEDYVFANTGIAIEGDFDTVILIENVHFDENHRIIFSKCPAREGDVTIPAGSEIKKGELLGETGKKLTPTFLARLAKGGYISVPVMKKPVVSFIPTGNELVPANMALPLKRNVDANSVLIGAMLQQWEAEPLLYPICPDNPDQLRETLEDAIKRSDIVIINAGSSKGSDDYNHEVLAEFGKVLNHQVDAGPGKHTSYTIAGKTPVIGISGPTGCADCTSAWYILPLINQYYGQSIDIYTKIEAVALTDMISRAPASMFFMLGCHVSIDAMGRIVVFPASCIQESQYKEDAVNCYIALNQNNIVKEGDTVTVELRTPFRYPRKEEDLLDAITLATFIR